MERPPRIYKSDAVSIGSYPCSAFLVFAECQYCGIIEEMAVYTAGF